MADASQKLAAQKLYAGNPTEGKIPAYLEQEVMSWSKEKIILKMYDLFLLANKKGDVQKMNRVLIELMSSLNFEYEETSTRLYRLYEYCQRAIFRKKYDEAFAIIKDLRDTWSKAFNLEPVE
ncbi:MAG TPA: flagellar protein FliS [Candidatus Kapabacteria bacterium]|jgi:flagellin-specific chaperone FliS|nr:flagellar protein FliS [Candidatus Kapabacteria bacterium]HOV92128.1 flagellar protein FliS [Candidatus Kapabacteria bacterium]